MENCIFCKIARGDIFNKKIYENDNFFSILDVNQKIKGHALVISKKHFKTILDIPDTLSPELLECIKKTIFKLMNEDKFDGFNIVNNNFEVAGQVVEHVHFHILPRRKGDGVKMIV